VVVRVLGDSFDDWLSMSSVLGTNATGLCDPWQVACSVYPQLALGSSVKLAIVLYLSGVFSVGLISAVLLQSGWMPLVSPCCPEETAQLVRVIGSAAFVLSLVIGFRLVWKSIKQLFSAPAQAIDPILHAAAVVAIAVLLPVVWGSASRLSSPTDTQIKMAQTGIYF
jgi:hypothetical protein